MFGLFRKKVPEPAPSPALPETPPETEAPAAELTPEQKKLINRELKRHADGKGNNLDASIGLLHLTGDQIYLKGILQFLENSEVGLLLKQPGAGADYLILTQNNLRYLPIFTRSEHARIIADKFPAYQHVGFVNSRAFFTKLEPGMGLWINPGHSVFTYMMPAAMFTAYVALLLKKGEPS